MQPIKNHIYNNFKADKFMYVHWDEIPFVRLLIPVIMGILLAIYSNFYLPNISLLLIVVTTVLVGLSLSKIKLSRLQSRLLFGGCFAFILLGVGYELTRQHTAILKPTHFNYHIDNQSFALAKVNEPLIAKARSYKAEVQILGLEKDGQKITTTGKAIIYFAKDSTEQPPLIDYGDVLLVKANWQAIAPPKNPHQFDYQRYLRFQNIYHQAYLRSENWRIVEKKQGNWLYTWVYTVRNRLLKVLQTKVTGRDEIGVASALLLGYKHFLEDEIIQTYSHTGAMHVLAVSGLHVGIIFILLKSFLGFLDKRGAKALLLKAILLIVGIWLFALITGLPPSVCRASVMFSFFAVGQAANRRTNIYNVLAASALLLLCFDPYMLLQVGFQLSYVAVFGIVALQPRIYRWFSFDNWLLDQAWQLTAVSLAAQLSTSPISFYYFNQFPTYFFLSNLIVIPAATLILYIGISLFAISWVPLLNDIVGKLLHYIIFGMNKILFLLQKLPFSHIEGLAISTSQLYLFYILIIGSVLFFLSQKSNYLKLSLLVLSIGLIGHLWNTHKEINQKQINIYALKNSSNIEFVSGKKSLLLADSTTLADEDKRLFNIQPNQQQSGIEEKTQYTFENFVQLPQDTTFQQQLHFAPPFIQFHDKRLMVLHEHGRQYQLDTPVEVDYLVLTKNAKVNLHYLPECLRFEQLIIDASNSYSRSKRWMKQCEELGMSCHNVKTDRAFTIRF